MDITIEHLEILRWGNKRFAIQIDKTFWLLYLLFLKNMYVVTTKMSILVWTVKQPNNSHCFNNNNKQLKMPHDQIQHNAFDLLETQFKQKSCLPIKVVYEA